MNGRGANNEGKPVLEQLRFDGDKDLLTNDTRSKKQRYSMILISNEEMKERRGTSPKGLGSE